MQPRKPVRRKTRPGGTNHANTGFRIWGFPERSHSKADIFYLVAGLLLLVVIAVGGGRALRLHAHAVEVWVTTLGPWGLLAFIALFVVTTSFFIPDTVLCIIAGSLFGLSRGITSVVAGSLLAASIQFALSHKLLRAKIQRKLAASPTLVDIQKTVSINQFRLQVLLRLTPMNPAIINYLLGAAGVRFFGFLLAFLAHIPNLAIEVYLGCVLRHTARLAGRRSADLHDMAIISGVVICIVVMVLISRMAHRAIMASLAENEESRNLSE